MHEWNLQRTEVRTDRSEREKVVAGSRAEVLCVCVQKDSWLLYFPHSLPRTLFYNLFACSPSLTQTWTCTQTPLQLQLAADGEQLELDSPHAEGKRRHTKLTAAAFVLVHPQGWSQKGFCPRSPLFMDFVQVWGNVLTSIKDFKCLHLGFQLPFFDKSLTYLLEKNKSWSIFS